MCIHCLFMLKALLCIYICVSVCVTSYNFDWLSSYQFIYQFITHSCAHHPALLSSFGQLDLSQLFASLKDKKILIELLCNSSSRCINRELDINHPAFVCLHLCVCVLGGWYVFFFFHLWLKAFPLIQQEAAVIKLPIPGDHFCSLMLSPRGCLPYFVFPFFLYFHIF